MYHSKWTNLLLMLIVGAQFFYIFLLLHKLVDVEFKQCGDQPMRPSSVELSTKATPSSAESLITFSKILEESKSDKHWRHHYERYYERWLLSYRHVEDIKMLEIGADTGKSLNVWEQYFTRPELIVGLAYGVKEPPVDHLSKTQVVSGNQSNPATLKKLCDMGPYEIIIDDGSHYPEHMVKSFMHLWKDCVKPGGLYVVEDLETNYWDKRTHIYSYTLKETGFGVSPEHSAIEKFKQLIDVLPRYELGGTEMMNILPGDDEICAIEFGMNIMAFHKCTEQEMEDHPENSPFGEVVDLSKVEAYFEKARKTNPK